MIEPRQSIEFPNTRLNMNSSRSGSFLLTSRGERLKSLYAAIKRRAVNLIDRWRDFQEVGSELFGLSNTIAGKRWVRDYACRRRDVGVVVSSRGVDVPVGAVLCGENVSKYSSR